MTTQTLPAFNIIGLNATVSNQDMAAIGTLWQTFQSRDIATELSNKLSDDLYCLYHGYQGDHNAPYDMCIEYRVPDNTATPEGLSLIRVPEQHYHTSEAQGEIPKVVMEQWQAIWSSDLPRTYQVDFDRYDATNSALVEIFVGIR